MMASSKKGVSAPRGPSEASPSHRSVVVSVSGEVPPEQWNRLGTRLLPKLRAAGNATALIRLQAEVDAARVAVLSAELKQVVDELGLSAGLRIETGKRSEN
jgi:hypothetical protein